MSNPCSRGLRILKLTFICCAVLSWTTRAQVPTRWANNPIEKRSLPLSHQSPPAATTTGGSISATTAGDPNACKKLPITPETWKLLNIDNTLKTLPGAQNMTIAQFATANGAGNFICAMGESCNAGQLCHPVRAPAWQVLYATQEYNAFMNAMMDSINYALSQLQAVSASMVKDLAPDIDGSRLEVNLEWIFTDMYRGIAYGTTALLLVAFLGFPGGFLTSILVAVDILGLTALGAGIAAWIQGPPKTASFIPWTRLGFYIAESQSKLAGHISEASEKIFNAGLTSENGLAAILSNGLFFVPPSPTGLMESMEKSILRITQGRLLSRLLRGQNAYVTIFQSDCQGKGPGGARDGKDVLSYCDPKEKLQYDIVRAHGKHTLRTIHGAQTITTKYGFEVEFIVRNSWECQQKYKNFEHDVFADVKKVTPADIGSLDCVFNLPVCDMREDDIRNQFYGKHRTTTLACRKGGGLPI